MSQVTLSPLASHLPCALILVHGEGINAIFMERRPVFLREEGTGSLWSRRKHECEECLHALAG